MSSPTPGSDPNYPQGGAPQGQPGWGCASSSQPQGYGAPQGYNAPGAPCRRTAAPRPAPARSPPPPSSASSSGRPRHAVRRCSACASAVSPSAPSCGLLACCPIAVGRRRCWSRGIQALQGKSPRLLLLISYAGDRHQRC